MAIEIVPEVKGRQRAQLARIIRTALRKSRFPFPAEQMTVQVRLWDGTYPQTWYRDPCVIEVPRSWVDKRWDTRTWRLLRAKTLTHELWHGYDVTSLPKETRGKLFTVLTGLEPTHWFFNGVVEVPRAETAAYWIGGNHGWAKEAVEQWACICADHFWAKPRKNRMATPAQQKQVIQIMEGLMAEEVGV